MENERDEVFERIPWETLERPAKDNNRLVMAVAGAVVLGAIGFSFVRSQPPPPAAIPPAVAQPAPPPATVAPPVLRAEADLYAVDHERMASHAASHAEWFVVEYVAYDGSEASRAILESLMPAGIPLPQAPEGTQVLVDWVGVVSVSELPGLAYEIELLVRSMVAAPGQGFIRQPPSRHLVEVQIGTEGLPRVVRPPIQMSSPSFAPAVLGLSPLPEDLRHEVESVLGPVVGGEQMSDGRWRVVVMAVDADGVSRPRTVTVP